MIGALILAAATGHGGSLWHMARSVRYQRHVRRVVQIIVLLRNPENEQMSGSASGLRNSRWPALSQQPDQPKGTKFWTQVIVGS